MSREFWEANANNPGVIIPGYQHPIMAANSRRKDTLVAEAHEVALRREPAATAARLVESGSSVSIQKLQDGAVLRAAPGAVVTLTGVTGKEVGQHRMPHRPFVEFADGRRIWGKAVNEHGYWSVTFEMPRTPGPVGVGVPATNLDIVIEKICAAGGQASVNSFDNFDERHSWARTELKLEPYEAKSKEDCGYHQQSGPAGSSS